MKHSTQKHYADGQSRFVLAGIKMNRKKPNDEVWRIKIRYKPIRLRSFDWYFTFKYIERPSFKDDTAICSCLLPTFFLCLLLLFFLCVFKLPPHKRSGKKEEANVTLQKKKKWNGTLVISISWFSFFRYFLFKETGMRSHFAHLHDTHTNTRIQTIFFSSFDWRLLYRKFALTILVVY